MKKLFASLTFITVLSLLPPSLNAEEKWTPSRKNWDGCKWTPYQDNKIGVKLFYQNCVAPNSHYEFSTKGNVIEQHRPSDDRTFNSHKVLEVFTKPAEMSIENAIKAELISKLSKNEQKNCFVKKQKTARPGVVRLSITPKDSYEKKVVAEFMKKNPAGGIPYEEICGPYGRVIGVTYFEYHPQESKTKYAHIIAGQDEQLFDENSIVFFDAK